MPRTRCYDIFADWHVLSVFGCSLYIGGGACIGFLNVVFYFSTRLRFHDLLCMQLLDCAAEALLIKLKSSVRWKRMCGPQSLLARWSQWFTRRSRYLKQLRLIGWWKLAHTLAKYCCSHDFLSNVCCLTLEGVSSSELQLCKTVTTSVCIMYWCGMPFF
jgi:hypothetical protein